MAAITVQGLTKRFGDVLAVDQLSFQVDEGTVAGFLGPNGAGKTTTLRQRLGLAAALLGDPEILILDEPANGLDPEGVHRLRGLVRGLAAEGRSVLVSSHLLAEVAQTVDQVAIIDKGRLVTQASMAELTAGADRTVRVRTPQPEALRDLLIARGATVTIEPRTPCASSCWCPTGP
jgi:ABC-2 type transport system ATP-binding protein